ncbi:MAG: helix-turn-helix domain-containing protein [Pseudomonadota bacterium]
MTRRQKEPLHELAEEERNWLEKIAHSRSEPISHVLRAKEILSVADGKTYLQAAQLVGRNSGDPVAELVKRFNQAGLNAIQPGHGGGPTPKYGTAERERILAEFRRQPDPELDGTKTWSLKTLERSLRKVADGLPQVSADTIRAVLRAAGYSWQNSRTWCQTGQVVRKRKRGKVVVTDPDAEAKKT